MKTKTIIFLFLLIVVGCKKSQDDLYWESRRVSDSGDDYTALTLINKALDLDSLNARYLRQKGYINSQLNNTEEALKDYLRSIEIDSTNATAYRNLGMILETICEYKSSTYYLKKSLEIDPNDAFIYFKLASNEFKFANYKGCEKYALKSIALDSELANPYGELGLVYTHNEEWEKAINNFHKAINRDATWSHYYNNRGYAYSSIGEHQLALDDYFSAISLDSLDPSFYLNIADIYNKENVLDSALWYYNKSILLIKPGFEGDFGIAYYNRGHLHLELGDTISAEIDFQMVDDLGFDPDNFPEFEFGNDCTTTYNNVSYGNGQ